MIRLNALAWITFYFVIPLMMVVNTAQRTWTKQNYTDNTFRMTFDGDSPNGNYLKQSFMNVTVGMWAPVGWGLVGLSLGLAFVTGASPESKERERKETADRLEFEEKEWDALVKESREKADAERKENAETKHGFGGVTIEALKKKHNMV